MIVIYISSSHHWTTPMLRGCLFWLFLAVCLAIETSGAKPVPDPCATIAGKTWVLPREARDCMSSFPLDTSIKTNVRCIIIKWITLTLFTLLLTNFQIIEVVNKTLGFHTSVNYQIQAPPPFDQDIHEDLVADLARISRESYPSEFEFHIDIYRSFKRVNDGHCGVYNYCYDCEQPTTSSICDWHLILFRSIICHLYSTSVGYVDDKWWLSARSYCTWSIQSCVEWIQRWHWVLAASTSGSSERPARFGVCSPPR